jgi:hypothetical protein
MWDEGGYRRILFPPSFTTSTCPSFPSRYICSAFSPYESSDPDHVDASIFCGRAPSRAHLSCMLLSGPRNVRKLVDNSCCDACPHCQLGNACWRSACIAVWAMQLTGRGVLSAGAQKRCSQRAAHTATSRSAVVILTSTGTPTPSPATSCQRSSFWMRHFMS